MRSAATSLFALAALAPSVAQAAPPSAHDPSEVVPRLRLNLGGPYSTAIAFGVHAAAGRNDPLLGPGFTGWRAVPELLFSIQPAPRLEIFAGGGAGAARVVPEITWATDELTAVCSAVLGVRFNWQGVPVTTTARTESIAGHGTAFTLGLRLNLDALGLGPGR